MAHALREGSRYGVSVDHAPPPPASRDLEQCTDQNRSPRHNVIGVIRFVRPRFTALRSRGGNGGRSAEFMTCPGPWDGRRAP
ncbi:hypothetical protein N7510_009643 [Penicillium lagena]|uniref:uncharacterized protein n=1 Tax=Penicillium lagena TaxID=94218 RepID=UPI00253F85B7|nr:uncharacterized protein N7510_009643 [Penicillium lagena]KAJ5604489.1 hypothetical protein N7510_009643 [Penicillium lagena]